MAKPMTNCWIKWIRSNPGMWQARNVIGRNRCRRPWRILRPFRSIARHAAKSPDAGRCPCRDGTADSSWCKFNPQRKNQTLWIVATPNGKRNQAGEDKPGKRSKLFRYSVRSPKIQIWLHLYPPNRIKQLCIFFRCYLSSSSYNWKRRDGYCSPVQIP